MKVYTHDCAHCALHKKYYDDIKIEGDDAKVYERIIIMNQNANQAVNDSALENLPSFVTEEDKAKYKEIVKKNKANAEALLAEWWILMRKKYPSLEDASKFDISTSKFFKCVDNNNVANVHGEFIAKQ